MTQTKKLRWVIWTLAALFYFYEYLLRVSPSVMVPELMSAFNVSADTLGILVASFLFVYAPMQLPVGILMDRFGARNLLTFASLGCGIGAILFAVAQTLAPAFIGRIIIGVSASFAFVGMVYVCTHWFEKSKRAVLVGVANSISMLGAIAGVGPLSIMVQRLGWRTTLLIFGAIGFLLAFVIYSTIRKKEPQKDTVLETHETPHSLFEGIKIFIKSIQSWLNAIIALLTYTVTTAMGGLWGVPFIQNSYHVSKEIASFAITMLFLGWLVGGPLFGLISDRVGNRKFFISSGVLLTFLSVTPIIYFTDMSITMVYILVFLTGLFSSSQLLNFTFATEINPKRIKGASIAVTNCIVASGGTIVQPLIGYLLVLKSAKATVGSNSYSSQDYRFALSILPLCLIVSWLLTFFLKEKNRNTFE